ncbi:heme exporter protein CcmD [Dokdonella fugitiva]|jgi:heme exporter protein D|uniref:Heme exporter protein D n=1 Tax=Dokdonella fugitiva TaxID=328517 RepID=A0A4R2I713_9GAMM|nr:heme exporter protein CcmD [Dokdonella fugitiva]MBA8884455.1 heme exporter protein D [Dokdonella fugitiva]TCO40054.1 heme exporter protein D [Dokdonella fugitiva]
MNDFLAMGGYGAYVWGSYAVFFVVLAIEALAPRATRRRVLTELRGRLRRREQRNEPSA